jgi:hypothetical protein
LVKVEPHEPAVHDWPALHALQVNPPLPHAFTAVPAKQTPVFVQHPAAQLEGSHPFAPPPHDGATANTRPRAAPRAKAFRDTEVMVELSRGTAKFVAAS